MPSIRAASVESSDLLRECSPAPRVRCRSRRPGSPRRSLLERTERLREPACGRRSSGLSILSEASGGFAVTNTNDFTGGLERIVEDLDHYYLLGFYPSDQKGTGYRPARRARPDHPDWTLRFRHGYMPGRTAAGRRRTATRWRAVGRCPARRATCRCGLTAIPLPGATPDDDAPVALALEVTAPVRALRDTDGKLARHAEVRGARRRREEGARAIAWRARRQAHAVADRRPEDAPATVSYQVRGVARPSARSLRAARLGDERSTRRRAAASISTSTCRTCVAARSRSAASRLPTPTGRACPSRRQSVRRRGVGAAVRADARSALLAVGLAARVFRGRAAAPAGQRVARRDDDPAGRVCSPSCPRSTPGDPLRVDRHRPAPQPGARPLHAAARDASRDGSAYA